MSWFRRKKPALVKPLPYTRRDRRADRRHGKRDGRGRLPTYAALVDLIEAGDRVSTPYQEQLNHAGLHQINEQYGAFQERIDPYRRRIAELDSAIALAGRRERDARARLEAALAPVSADDLTPRNPQELALVGTPELASRREAARHRRIDAIREQIEQCREQRDGQLQRKREAEGLIRQELELARTRGRWLADYYTVRIAAYWDAVVRNHPEGRSLASMLPLISLAPPAWMAGPGEEEPGATERDADGAQAEEADETDEPDEPSADGANGTPDQQTTLQEALQ